MTETSPTSWHVPADTLLAYAQDRVRDADAWSVEAHLEACPRCTEALVLAVAGTGAGSLVEAVRPRLLADLPVQVSAPRPTAARRSWFLATSGTGARWAWWGAVAFTVVVAVALSASGAGAGRGGPAAAGGGFAGSWLTVVAPLLPLLGVALSYGTADPARELVASTPSGGLRLLLWRTLAVLVVSLPAALVTGLVVGLAAPAQWLLPSLALTALTLALGSFVELARAAVGVGAGWLVAVVGPGLGASTPVLLEARFVPFWLALVLLGGVAVAARRDAFSLSPSSHAQEIS